MEERKLTCIGCPMGCQLQVIIKKGIVEKVTGNTCKRGADYGKKEVGTKGVFYPTGDVDKDIHTIREMYRGVTACHPENFVQV